MIEGMLVVRGAHTRNAAEMKRLLARAHAVGMEIALGLPRTLVSSSQPWEPPHTAE